MNEKIPFETLYLQAGSELENLVFECMKSARCEESIVFYRDYQQLVDLSSSPDQEEEYVQLLNNIRTKYLEFRPPSDFLNDDGDIQNTELNVSMDLRKKLLDDLDDSDDLDKKVKNRKQLSAFEPVVREVVSLIAANYMKGDEAAIQNINEFMESPKSQEWQQKCQRLMSVKAMADKFEELKELRYFAEGPNKPRGLFGLSKSSAQKREEAIHKMLQSIQKLIPIDSKKLAKSLSKLKIELDNFAEDIEKLPTKGKLSVLMNQARLEELARKKKPIQDEKSEPDNRDKPSFP